MEIDRLNLSLDYGLTLDGDGEVAALSAIGDGPLTIVNLFALHQVARYDNGDTCSGVEAMLRYSAGNAERLASLGGGFITTGLPTGVLWGSDDDWDVLAVASYPDVSAFWSLLADPGYRDAFVHRRAAVARQRVTAAVPLA